MTDESIFRELRGTIAIDTETHDPFLDTWGPGWARKDGGRVLGIVVTDENRSDYLPIAHNPGVGGNMDKDKVVSWLKAQLKKPDLNIIFANAMYDIGWLGTEGIEVKGRIDDVLMAAAMLDEYKKHNLDSVAMDVLGVGKDEAKLHEYAKQMGIAPKDIKKNFARMHPSMIKQYAEQDGRVTFDAWPILKQRLLKPAEVERLPEAQRDRYYNDNLPKLFDCYDNVEKELIPALYKIRKQGIRIDQDGVEKAAAILKQKEINYLKEIKRITGFDIIPTETASIVPALKQYGVKFPITKKTGKESVTKDFLDSLEETLEGQPGAEIPRMIIRARKISKIRSTYVEPILTRYAVDGRIHCSLNPLPIEKGGTKTGRFSCTSPNLQNQPNPEKDDEDAGDDEQLGLIVRSFYLPEEGDNWAVMDYKQQEPRLTVHYADMLDLPGASKAVEAFHKDPSTCYHTLVANLANITKKQAKPINLGRSYGMGGLSLCKRLGLPTEWITIRGELVEVAGKEGRELLQQYDEHLPFISKLSKECDVLGRRRGFIRTILGRHCRFTAEENEYGIVKYTHTYRAMNKLIQGSAADQIKKALIELHNAGIHILLTVHDEIDISYNKKSDLSLAVEIMKTCVPLRIPVGVDVEVGPAWGKVQEIKDIA